ncbi:MAG: hypothetical protein DWI67_07555 [Chloroflexi bacterium]|nr:MAG: hypothetical protein DWI64_05765 [Chloroflexota bacterium]RLT51418.1 MAG: hypothetical protein DWI67_07555 [Chloroflexota bacterium]
MHPPAAPMFVMHCDCCGARMQAHACKIACARCGYRLDCSDLSLNFDPPTALAAPAVAASAGCSAGA